MRDKTHSIQSLTDDILQEVSDNEQLEKTAAEAPPEYKTELASSLIKAATEFRKFASQPVQVTEEDLAEFAAKRGIQL